LEENLNCVKRFQATVLILYSKALAGKTLGEIGARLETSVNKLLAQLAQPTGLFPSSAGYAL